MRVEPIALHECVHEGRLGARRFARRWSRRLAHRRVLLHRHGVLLALGAATVALVDEVGERDAVLLVVKVVDRACVEEIVDVTAGE